MRAWRLFKSSPSARAATFAVLALLWSLSCLALARAAHSHLLLDRHWTRPSYRDGVLRQDFKLHPDSNSLMEATCMECTSGFASRYLERQPYIQCHETHDPLHLILHQDSNWPYPFMARLHSSKATSVLLEAEAIETPSNSPDARGHAFSRMMMELRSPGL